MIVALQAATALQEMEGVEGEIETVGRDRDLPDADITEMLVYTREGRTIAQCTCVACLPSVWCVLLHACHSAA